MWPVLPCFAMTSHQAIYCNDKDYSPQLIVLVKITRILLSLFFHRELWSKILRDLTSLGCLFKPTMMSKKLNFLTKMWTFLTCVRRGEMSPSSPLATCQVEGGGKSPFAPPSYMPDWISHCNLPSFEARLHNLRSLQVLAGLPCESPDGRRISSIRDRKALIESNISSSNGSRKSSKDRFFLVSPLSVPVWGAIYDAIRWLYNSWRLENC